MTDKKETESRYEINRFTGEFVFPETEKEFSDISWSISSRWLLIALLLCSINFLFANNIPRPDEYPEYRTVIIPLTKIFAIFLLVIAVTVWKSKRYTIPLRIFIVMSEITIGLLQSADHYFFLRFINKFYDIGTSFLVFYILIFYIVIPNRLKITFFTNIGISIAFIIITNLSGTTTFPDLFSISMYFTIANALGYGILLNSNKSRREEYFREIQLKKAEKEALEAKLLAEEADKAKSRFLAMMNHEMRTPLNVVLGGVRILDSEPLSDNQKETIAMVRNSGELLKVLIQNVLDFTSIERNRLKIMKARFSLKEMTGEIDKIYSHVSEENGLSFSIVYGCTAVDYVNGDSIRLRQILINLLNNAVKFTCKGSISLRAKEVERTTGNVILRFEVTDTGIGISEKHFAEIVKPFTQVEQSATRHFDGSGLGLAICSELLNTMGSRLEISSKEGSGSTFSFDLSLELAEASSADDETPEIDSYRILLIDDIEANLKITGSLLESLNQQVVCARGSSRGIEKSRMYDFDAVIIDLHMPGKDGMETVREIRKRHPDIVAFLMTADTREEVFAEFRNAGFTDFIPKPVDMGQLKDALKKIKPEAPAADRDAIIDQGFISELKNDLGDKVFIEVIKSCVETLEKDALKINGPHSIDDWEDFIHQLKGVAGNYRLMRLSRVLEGCKPDISTFDHDQLAETLEESIGALNEALDELL